MALCVLAGTLALAGCGLGAGHTPGAVQLEVTRDFGGESSRFARYMDTSKQLEAAAPDPAHPSPLRTKLQHIESQL